MNIGSVRLFLEVVDAGSLSRVASRRQTVQSHVSRQIAEFERGFGAALFRRTGRGVAPTELGERVAARLRHWLLETERLTEELRNETGRLIGDVRLGVIPSAAHPLTTRLYERLQREHPGVRLNIAEAQGLELDAMLDNGVVDLAIRFRADRPGGSDEKLLCVVRTYLVSAPDDPVTAAESVPFSGLRNLRLVLPRRPSHWRHVLDEAARDHGFRLDAAVEADSLTVQKELVAANTGLCSILGPYAMTRELRAGRLRASRLVEPDLERHVTLALPRQGKLTPAGRFVGEVIRELVAGWGNELSEPGEAGGPD